MQIEICCQISYIFPTTARALQNIGAERIVQRGQKLAQNWIPRGKFCTKTPKGQKFFTTSSQNLRGLLVSISNHLVICRDCPSNIKLQLSSYKTTHETQLHQLKEGEHDACMRLVWKRLIGLNKARESEPAGKAIAPEIPRVPIQYSTVDPSMQLVAAEVESLVTPFTYFTMQQVR